MSIGYHIGQPVKAPGSFEVDGSLAVQSGLNVLDNAFTVDPGGTVGIDGSLDVHESVSVAVEVACGDLTVVGTLTRHKAKIVTVTANTTVQASQSGSTFVVTGGSGVTFTLPAPEEGLVFNFVNMPQQTMSVESDLYRIYTHGEDHAGGVAFSGAAKTGAACRAIATSAGWIITNTSDLPMTVL